MSDRLISNGQARRIAAEWHGGQITALCALATSGHIDAEQLHAEIAGELRTLDRTPDYYEDPAYLSAELRALDKYVTHHGNRTTVDGWHNLWDDQARVTPDQT